MLRLFVTLYLAVLSAFIFFAFTLDKLPDALAEITDVDELEYLVTKGSFNLLDKAAEGINKDEKEAMIEDYRSQFGSLFDLLPINEIPLDDKQRERLQQGLIVSIERDDFKPESYIGSTVSIGSKDEDEFDETPVNPESPTMHYRKLPNSELAWQIHLDIDVNVSNFTTTVKPGKYSDGMFYLLQQQLDGHAESEWQGIVDRIRPQFAIPLSLEKMAKQTAEPDALTALKAGEVVNLTQTQRPVNLAQRIASSDSLLKAGPVYLPWNIFYLGHLLLAALALTFATAIFLWILPLWKSLTRLRNAAYEFGKGHYDTRIRYSKHSGTAPISAAFNAMAEQTQNTIRSHKELTTAVSHELRTPVSRMRFSLDMLASDANEVDRLRYIDNMNTDIDELNAMLEELLTYARFDQGNQITKPRPSPINDWFENTLQTLLPLTKGKSLTWDTNGLPKDDQALFDPDMMSRVVNNLVQNAIRYADSRIDVNLSKQNQHYLLYVDDDGEGIAEAERERLFEAFATLDSSRNKETTGFGLGLAIVKRIIDAHHGQVAIETSPYGGSRIAVKWPI